MTRLHVCDHGKPIDYSFEDLLKYHGYGFPGGVAHAFKVMELAFATLSPDSPPERHDVHIHTAFRGPGARDAFEMITRAVTGGRYHVDPNLEATARGTTLERYVFRLSYHGQTVELQIRDGHVRDEFITLARQAERTPVEEERLTWLKQEMADRLMRLPADAVYQVL